MADTTICAVDNQNFVLESYPRSDFKSIFFLFFRDLDDEKLRIRKSSSSLFFF